MIRVLIPLMLTSVLVAEDWDDEAVSYADLRLTVGLPTARMHSEYRPSSAATLERSENSRWDGSSRIGLEWLPWPGKADGQGAGMLALGISSLHFTLDGDSTHAPLNQRLVLVDLHIGVGWVPAQRWTAELTGFAGVGRGWQTGAGRTGPAYEAGMRLASTYRLGSFLLGAQVSAGWLDWTSTAELDGVDYDLRFSAFGVTPALIAGFRF
jgi:hypothetical protein